MDEKVIIKFYMVNRNTAVDLEIPTDISTIDLLRALNNVYSLGIDTSDIKQCYIKMENPIALMRGNKLLSNYNIRNGSILFYYG